jgi:hypothetical protein
LQIMFIFSFISFWFHYLLTTSFHGPIFLFFELFFRSYCVFARQGAGVAQSVCWLEYQDLLLRRKWFYLPVAESIGGSELHPAPSLIGTIQGCSNCGRNVPLTST